MVTFTASLLFFTRVHGSDDIPRLSFDLVLTLENRHSVSEVNSWSCQTCTMELLNA